MWTFESVRGDHENVGSESSRTDNPGFPLLPCLCFLGDRHDGHSTTTKAPFSTILCASYE